MLTPIDDAPVVAGATAQADKQISASGNTANAVLYTVPSGRRFLGWASNGNGTSSGNYMLLVAGGVEVHHYSGFSTIPTTNMPADSPQFTLLAGSSIKNGSSNYGYVFGVESDA